MGGSKPAPAPTPAPAAAPQDGAPDLDFGGEEAPAAPDAPQSGGSEKPFDSQPFDAGVEADEQSDPKKFIEQLTGKLGQSLRKYTETQGNPDFALEKFAINSVLAATHTAEMEPQDQKDIINKVKSSGEGAEDVPADGEEVDIDVAPEEGGEVDVAPEGEGELNEMALTDHNVIKLLKIYDNGTDQLKTILTRLVSFSNNISREEFLRDLQDEIDYEDIHYIFGKLKQLGVDVSDEEIQEESIMLKNPKKNNMFQKGSNDILKGEVKENLESPEKKSNFVSKSQIKAKLTETFQDDEKEPDMQTTVEPEVKPAVKPSRTTEPQPKPSRKNKPFLPSVTPGVKPQPKASNG